MMGKIFGDEAKLSLFSSAFIFAQVSLLPQKFHRFPNNSAIALLLPYCNLWRSPSSKQQQVLTQIEAKVGDRG